MASVKRPSMLGLQQSLQPNVDDPLGTNVKRRGMDAYYEEARKSDPRYASGPLPDPQWAGVFQAMADQGVSKIAMDAGRPHGIADDPTQPGWAPPEVDPNMQSVEALRAQQRMQPVSIAAPSEVLMRLSGKKKKPEAR